VAPDLLAARRSLHDHRAGCQTANFPFGRGPRGGGLISTQLQGGRGTRLASWPGFRSAQSGLQPATACAMRICRASRANMPARGSIRRYLNGERGTGFAAQVN